jgi:mRNA degradation ribonuclease J1/J2
VGQPIVESRGFVFSETKGKASDVKELVEKTAYAYDYENGTNEDLALAIKKALKNYLFKKNKQSPLILVNVVEV